MDYSNATGGVGLINGISPNLYGMILAGGIGTRLMPYSTSTMPKQFLPITSDKTMIQETFERLTSSLHGPVAIRRSRIYIATLEEYMDIVRQQLPSVRPENILRQPFQRNTAPAITALMQHISVLDNDSVVVVAPSDHWIRSAQIFMKAVIQAARLASGSDVLVTFGILPKWAETAYGYIEKGNEYESGVFNAKSFVEKPSVELAEEFVKNENHFWNSGIFVWNTRTFLRMMHKYQPDIASAALRAFGNSSEAMTFNDAIADFLRESPSVSIDRALMKRAASDGHVIVIPLGTEWSDVGTWKGIRELRRKGYVSPPPEMVRHLHPIEDAIDPNG